MRDEAAEQGSGAVRDGERCEAERNMKGRLPSIRVKGCTQNSARQGSQHQHQYGQASKICNIAIV